jgi:hypothetical protein
MEAIDLQGPFTPDELWDGLIPNEDEQTIEAILTRGNNIREAQDAWAKLNRCLHRLGPLTPDVLEGWDRIKPWLDSQGLDVTHLRKFHRETVFPPGL